MNIHFASCIGVAMLLCVSLSKAQEAKVQPLHPGDVIKVEIKFHGPDADKIQTVSLSISTNTPVPASQPGFAPGFTGNPFTPDASKAFHPEFKIPDNAIDGDYQLFVSCIAGPFRPSYEAGKDFQYPTIHIVNEHKFTRPSIEVKPLP